MGQHPVHFIDEILVELLDFGDIFNLETMQDNSSEERSGQSRRIGIVGDHGG